MLWEEGPHLQKKKCRFVASQVTFMPSPEGQERSESQDFRAGFLDLLGHPGSFLAHGAGTALVRAALETWDAHLLSGLETVALGDNTGEPQKEILRAAWATPLIHVCT